MLNLNRPYADLKVLGLMADMAACGYYRLEYPFEYLRRLGATADTTGAVTLDLLDAYDVIVVQRNYDPRLRGLLAEAQRRPFHKVLVYEVDDFLHGVHPYSPAYQTFRPGGPNLHEVNTYLGMVDGLFVSTPELAGEYSSRTRRTWVLPNGLDFGIRNWETPAPRHPSLQGKTVIGWAGSSFHPDDMLPLQGSLKRVLERNPHVLFAICSGPQQVQQFLAPLDLPREQVVVLDPVPFWDYPQLLSQFDLGLAPLSNTVFNRCKSELKLLEYGAWGIPYVATRVAPYHRFHQATQGQGGALATSMGEWEGELDRVLNDPDLRVARGQFLQTCVREHYSLERNTYLWATALRQARDLARYQPDVELKHAATTARKPGRNDACPCHSGKKYKKCCIPAYG